MKKSIITLFTISLSLIGQTSFAQPISSTGIPIKLQEFAQTCENEDTFKNKYECYTLLANTLNNYITSLYYLSEVQIAQETNDDARLRRALAFLCKGEEARTPFCQQ